MGFDGDMTMTDQLPKIIKKTSLINKDQYVSGYPRGRWSFFYVYYYVL